MFFSNIGFHVLNLDFTLFLIKIDLIRKHFIILETFIPSVFKAWKRENCFKVVGKRDWSHKPGWKAETKCIAAWVNK